MAVTAYVLIQTEVGKAAQVAEQVARIEGVVSADDVTGPYLPCDCIAPDASFTDSEALSSQPRGFYRLQQW